MYVCTCMYFLFTIFEITVVSILMRYYIQSVNMYIMNVKIVHENLLYIIMCTHMLFMNQFLCEVPL